MKTNQIMKHLIEETLLAYVANQTPDPERQAIDTHLADCGECAAATRRLFVLRANFSTIWNEWSAGIHGEYARGQSLASLLSSSASPVVEKARLWIQQIVEGGELTVKVLMDSGRRVASLAASTIPTGFEFELRPVVAGVGSAGEDLELDQHLHHGSAHLASDRTEDAIRELEAASQINAFVAQSAVSVLYRKGRKYAEVSADSRRGTVAIKHWPAMDGPRANFALVMPKSGTDSPRIAELESVPGEEYMLAQFEDFRSGQFDLILGPCGG